MKKKRKIFLKQQQPAENRQAVVMTRRRER